MVGKREKKRNRRWLPGMMALVASIGLLLTTGGPSGVAADSPVEQAGQEALPMVRTVEEIRPLAISGEEEPEELKQPAGPVPESAPVEDTYFETVAFLGDSRTEGFKLYSGLESGTYYYAVGATVESVFTKKVETEDGEMPLLDAMADDDFEKIYVMLGVNELGWKGTDLYHDQYGLLIDRLREDHPDTTIVLQTILPVSAKQEEKKSYVNNARIAEYNAVIEVLAEEKECPYLNVAELVVDETGCLRSDWTSDGVHLNITGCKAWLEYLKTHAI